MLLLEHLLLSLANSIELSVSLAFGSLDYLLFDLLSLLLHLLAVFEVFDHVALRLSLLLDLALHPCLSLLLFRDSVKAFCVLIPYLLGLPLSKLFFHFSSLLEG